MSSSFPVDSKNSLHPRPESSPESADYGLDAPPVVRNLVIAGAASLLAGYLAYLILGTARSGIAAAGLNIGLGLGICCLIAAGLMVWSSKVGKVRLREWLMDSLTFRGNEMVLDVGCGRGLLLNAAAQRLITGTAIGIDLWRDKDQSDNHPEATLANARAEGVLDRVEVRSGDMRKLPFPDESIDVVVASLSIHNIPDKAGRQQAVREMARVLKPRGWIALLDFQCTDEYAQTLRDLGWTSVERTGLIFWMFPPVRVVRGRKPQFLDL